MTRLPTQVLFHLALQLDDENVSTFFRSKGASRLTYDQLAWRLGELETSSLRGAVGSLKKAGYCTTFTTSKGVVVQLTSPGKEALLRLLPSTIAQRTKWDRTWRILLLKDEFSSIPMAWKARFRRGLHKAFFVHMSRGVYISPFEMSTEIKELCTDKVIASTCYVVESKKFVYGDEQLLFHLGWALERKDKQWANIGNKVNLLLTEFLSKKRLTNTIKTKYMDLSRQTLVLLEGYPPIPAELSLSGDVMSTSLRNFLSLTALLAEY